jgi:hypothetical protein
VSLLSYLPLQIKQESFLEDINNLLNAGEVPNLFAIDEKQEICEKMRQLDRLVPQAHLISYQPRTTKISEVHTGWMV